jgi:hypothetical protein
MEKEGETEKGKERSSKSRGNVVLGFAEEVEENIDLFFPDDVDGKIGGKPVCCE